MKKKIDFVESWVNYIKKNPSTWREQHTRFIDDQLRMSNAALNNLRKTKEGKLKLIKLRNITNKTLIQNILKKT